MEIVQPTQKSLIQSLGNSADSGWCDHKMPKLMMAVVNTAISRVNTTGARFFDSFIVDGDNDQQGENCIFCGLRGQWFSVLY